MFLPGQKCMSYTVYMYIHHIQLHDVMLWNSISPHTFGLSLPQDGDILYIITNIGPPPWLHVRILLHHVSDIP